VHNRVSKIYAFGSSVTDHFDPIKSDIDMVLDLDITDSIEHGETLLSLWDNLGVFLNGK